MNRKTIGIAIAMLAIATASQVMSAEPPSIRAAVGEPLQAAQKALAAKDYKAALAKIAAAEATADLTPYERYIIARLKSSAAVSSNDYKAALAAMDQVLASPELPPADKPSMLETYIRLAYASKDFDKTATAIAQYKQSGGHDAELLSLQPQALYLAGHYQQASVELNQQIAATEAAGRKPSDTQLQLLASSALKLGDMAAYTAALEKLVVHTPKKEYWLDLILRTAGRPGFSDRLDLDVYRLRIATGTLDKADDYMEAAQLALQGGYPGEAQGYLDAGYAAGLLGAGADASRYQRLKELVAKKTAEDKATLAEGEKAAAALPGGDALINTGLNYVGYRQPEKGVPLIEAGIAKGGLKAADQAQLHLGYAQLAAGHPQPARQAFASVQGTDGARDLARLWTLHIRSGAAATLP